MLYDDLCDAGVLPDLDFSRFIFLDFASVMSDFSIGFIMTKS